ncbi:hypothetical protein WL92_01945 [Burkholderia multivorans]|nr:hypothetical protein WL92_01945 [Burkholderia multivorans]
MYALLSPLLCPNHTLAERIVVRKLECQSYLDFCSTPLNLGRECTEVALPKERNCRWAIMVEEEIERSQHVGFAFVVATD